MISIAEVRVLQHSAWRIIITSVRLESMNSLNRLINFKLALKKTVIMQLFIFILVRKKEENLKGVIQERTLRLKERNDELISHV